MRAKAPLAERGAIGHEKLALDAEHAVQVGHHDQQALGMVAQKERQGFVDQLVIQALEKAFGLAVREFPEREVRLPLFEALAVLDR